MCYLSSCLFIFFSREHTNGRTKIDEGKKESRWRTLGTSELLMEDEEKDDERQHKGKTTRVVEEKKTIGKCVLYE